MSKFVIAVLLVTFAVCNGRPNYDNAIANAAAAGNWEEFQRLLNSMHSRLGSPLSQSSLSVRDLKPSPGGRVYGQSEYTFHTASNLNGAASERSGGHRIINDNGHITEYDFTPSRVGYSS